jgi:hypothetical protein
VAGISALHEQSSRFDLHSVMSVKSTRKPLKRLRIVSYNPAIASLLHK